MQAQSRRDVFQAYLSNFPTNLHEVKQLFVIV